MKIALVPLALLVTAAFAASPPVARVAGPPPGVVVATTPDRDISFIGSPTLAILPDGTYIAAHDFFGRKSPLLHHTRIFASRDRGANWSQLAHLPDQFWSTLFVHRGQLFLLGTAREYGDIVLRRSTDGGRSWSTPIDARSGRLFAGRFVSAPTPVVAHRGRLWRAFEEYTGPKDAWSGRFFRAMVVSAPEDADLLDAAQWQPTNGLDFDGEWIRGDRTGWLEGNMVVAPGGSLVNIMRVRANPTFADRFPLEGAAAGIPRFEVAARLEIGADSRSLEFHPARGFFQFPGSQSKFTIRYDPNSRRYWSLVQKITNPYSGYGPDYTPSMQRNVLVLTASTDLRRWEERSIVLRWREGLPIHQGDRVGFQYVDWQFDGDDIVAVSRTAWDGQNYHNANYVTFHRLRGFRTLTMADSPPDLATE